MCKCEDGVPGRGHSHSKGPEVQADGVCLSDSRVHELEASHRGGRQEKTKQDLFQGGQGFGAGTNRTL